MMKRGCPSIVPFRGPLTSFKSKTTISDRFIISSGEWIRTTDIRVMSKNPESLPFMQRVIQTLARSSKMYQSTEPANAGFFFTWSGFIHNQPLQAVLLPKTAGFGDQCHLVC